MPEFKAVATSTEVERIIKELRPGYAARMLAGIMVWNSIQPL